MTPDGITLAIGGSRGIGAATATLLAEQGRKVIVVDILTEPALETDIAWGALSKERLIRNAAMNRLVEPIEVAQAIGWLLSPAILITMSLVIANAISISVRERRTEMAVLKVLGFQPKQILILVIGEAILIGALSGLASTGLAYGLSEMRGGFKFPIAFFPSFNIPAAALWWGPALGALTSLIGSVFPAFFAQRVKVSEVFAKIT
jgi:predicted lysophospholipase L1 biosynthesis ABC-type transport system permease subunit